MHHHPFSDGDDARKRGIFVAFDLYNAEATGQIRPPLRQRLQSGVVTKGGNIDSRLLRRLQYGSAAFCLHLLAIDG
jgi:hypothetical protein